ncbi:MAG: hypothetical protein NTX48_10585 [Planctomycetales bacterium]|nr:hypothetical protein [Planctomycetales bacterium]
MHRCQPDYSQARCGVPGLVSITPENAPGPDVDYPTLIGLALEIVSHSTEARTRDYEVSLAIMLEQASLNTGLSIRRKIGSRYSCGKHNNYVEHGGTDARRSDQCAAT